MAVAEWLRSKILSLEVPGLNSRYAQRFFPHFYPTVTVLLEYLDTPTLFLFYNSVAENSFGFPTTKGHLYNNLPMHTAIFKLLPSVINPVGMSKVQPFSMQINAPFTLDTYQIQIELCT